MGECIDNTRTLEMFGILASNIVQAIKDMPFAFASPVWSSEKGIKCYKKIIKE